MKHYKDPNTNEIFAYEEDGSQDSYIPSHLIPITNQEADVLRSNKEKAFFDSLTYEQKRMKEYPPIFDYIDGLVKNDQAQIDAYIAACQAVKAKYPKT